MRVTFHIQARLPEGMGREVAHPAIAEIIGSEVRTVLERVDFGDIDDLDLLVELRKVIESPLVTGVQITIEGLNE